MKTVYVVTDWDDCRVVHVFRQRRNAIQWMYEQCEAFGAYLSVNVRVNGLWQYQSLNKVVGDNDPVDYLNALNDEVVNDAFYEYYFFNKAEIEDVEG